MVRNRFLITLLACLFSSVCVSGQTFTLSLERALDIALSDNPTIKVADMEIERQKYERKQTEANLWPQLSATGQYLYAIDAEDAVVCVPINAGDCLLELVV